MGIYALVKDGLVINTIIWNGDDFEFDEGVRPVEILDGASVSPGYLYKNNKFSAPPLTAEQLEEQRLQMVASNQAVKSELLAQATAAIAPLQDAVDLDEATSSEAASLKKWKQYRIAVNRINANTPDDISWPEQPQ